MDNAKQRLIVALDFPTPGVAEKLVSELGDNVNIYKVGLELLYSGGTELAQKLVGEGKSVFIDAKLLDIGNTVEAAVRQIAKLGATFLSIHGTDRKTMTAAVSGRGDYSLKLLAITVMTNLDQQDLNQQGISATPEEMVLKRAEMSLNCGFDGIVSSAHEASVLRQSLGGNFSIVTPGIRPRGSDSGDQSRIMTPSEALGGGASHLVVGRPITKAPDPRSAALAILEEMTTVLG
ncbi:MAG: orotidine-5'-phosphate decarboxylase [Methyloligellaceae bacterium]